MQSIAFLLTLRDKMDVSMAFKFDFDAKLWLTSLVIKHIFVFLSG